MCDLDGEHPEFQSTTWRVARKTHKCYACNEAINPGDRYHVTSGKWDGDFGTYKHCARCWQMCEALWEAGAEWVDYGLDCGEVWQDVFGEPSTEVATLAFALPEDFREIAS